MSRKQYALKALTINLMATYNKINEDELKVRKKALAEPVLPERGDVLKGRYLVTGKWGCGSFGVVMKASDLQRNMKLVAVKIAKPKPSILEQAKVEETIWKQIEVSRQGQDCGIVSCVDIFDYKAVPCMVFEGMDQDVYERFIRPKKSRQISALELQTLARDMFTALEFLHRPTSPTHRTIIHCDVKPENIMVAFGPIPRFKLIDLGSACFQDHKMFSYIQSRFYRAPEVLFQLPYDTSIDVWSLGCVLWELRYRSPLFEGQDEQGQQLHILRRFGLPNAATISKSPVLSRKYFEFRSQWRLRDEFAHLYVFPAAAPLTFIPDVPGGVPSVEDRLLDNLLLKLLSCNPDRRLTAFVALSDPFCRAP